MGALEVAAFLTALAVRERVAASTQNQALSALLFLYREVLGVELPWLDDLVRAKRSQYLPVVPTREEVRAVIRGLDGVTRLMTAMLYGAGLRLLECCRLRIKDIDFSTNQITIRDGKGGKDRTTMLPAAIKPDLTAHIERARQQHIADVRAGSSFPLLSRESTQPRGGNGRGSGSFRRHASMSTASRVSEGVITCTSPCCSAL
jgi:integrase